MTVQDDEILSMGQRRRQNRAAGRKINREVNMDLLRKAGVNLNVVGAAGEHVIVAHDWDYWPGTDRWKERRGIKGQPKREGRGVEALLALVRRAS